MATLSKNRIFEEGEAVEELHAHGFGERSDGKLALAPVEALYLLEKKHISVKARGKRIAWGKLLSALEKAEPDIANKYAVYKDLRDKGYVARTGLKYGAHFRVYERGVRVGEGHSHWLVHVVPEEWKTSIYDISRAIRLAHSVRKKMIWAIVDTEGDVTYYKMERITP